MTSTFTTISWRDRLKTDSLVTCIETNYGTSRWLRSQPHDKEIIVVESSSYGNPLEHGYSMIFVNADEYLKWINNQIIGGWKVTFVGETEPLNEETIKTTRDRILQDLRSK